MRALTWPSSDRGSVPSALTASLQAMLPQSGGGGGRRGAASHRTDSWSAVNRSDEFRSVVAPALHFYPAQGAPQD